MEDGVPSTMPRPDRRMGTRERDCGSTEVVVYSNPMGVSSYASHPVSKSLHVSELAVCGLRWGQERSVVVLTLGPSTGVRAEARASTPTMVAISLTRALTSRVEVLFDRRRLSLPSKQGCRETWTLDGRDILEQVELRRIGRVFGVCITTKKILSG